VKNIFIITTVKIYQGNSAAAGRLMNIAKSLALSKNKVFLCSANLNKKVCIENLKEISQNIFLVGEEEQVNRSKLAKKINIITYIFFIIKYLFRINNLLKQIDGEKIFYLYPTGNTSMDLMCLIMFKVLNKYKIYYDVNEIRRFTLNNRLFSKNLLKRVLEVLVYYKDFLGYSMVEKLTRYYDGLVVISTNIEKYFKKYNNNLLRVPILSDASEKILSTPPTFGEEDKFLICFTGMISLKKEGFDLLFKALSQVKLRFNNLELHLYGPISKHGKDILLNVLPLKYGIKENIIYHGIVNRLNIIKEMQKNHLLILPRPLDLQTKYGFSTKLSEYLISGIPVLVTDVSDNSLYIKDGVNGFIVKPGDINELAEKILYIISDYSKITDKIGVNAFKTAKQNFHYANYSKVLSDFLQ